MPAYRASDPHSPPTLMVHAGGLESSRSARGDDRKGAEKQALVDSLLASARHAEQGGLPLCAELLKLAAQKLAMVAGSPAKLS